MELLYCYLAVDDVDAAEQGQVALVAAVLSAATFAAVPAAQAAQEAFQLAEVRAFCVQIACTVLSGQSVLVEFTSIFSAFLAASGD